MADPLVTIFGGKTKARILTVLLSHPSESFHLRGLAQAAGTDSGNTSKLLKPLVESGLVLATLGRESTPNFTRQSTLYSINSQSLLAAPLRQLVACAGSLMADLRAVVGGIGAANVGVYGSMAAGTDNAKSDIDVLAVGSLSGVAAQTAFKAAGRKHHKKVNVVAITAAELEQKLQEGRAFWASVADGQKIDLKGAWDAVAHSPAVAS